MGDSLFVSSPLQFDQLSLLFFVTLLKLSESHTVVHFYGVHSLQRGFGEHLREENKINVCGWTSIASTLSSNKSIIS